jgi:hypothetical protein
LHKEEENVMLNHPYIHAEKKGHDVNWTKLKSLKMLKEEYNKKYEKILIKTQFMLDTVISRILGNFWRKIHAIFVGIPYIRFTKQNLDIKGNIELEKKVDSYLDFKFDLFLTSDNDDSVPSIDVLYLSSVKNLRILMVDYKKKLIYFLHLLLRNIGIFLEFVPDLRDGFRKKGA